MTTSARILWQAMSFYPFGLKINLSAALNAALAMLLNVAVQSDG
jgi:hypothetical protein